MAKFDPFLALDCARVESVGAQSKERKGSNFAAQRSKAIVQMPEGPKTYNLKFWLSPSGNHGFSQLLLGHSRPQVSAIDSACERLALNLITYSHLDRSQDQFQQFCPLQRTTLSGKSSTASCWRPSRRSRASSPPTGTDWC